MGQALKDGKRQGLTADYFKDTEAVQRAAAQAVRDALRRHKEAGVGAVIWRDGEVVIVPPEEIEVPEE
jgi:hypothetical protein